MGGSGLDVQKMASHVVGAALRAWHVSLMKSRSRLMYGSSPAVSLDPGREGGLQEGSVLWGLSLVQVHRENKIK